MSITLSMPEITELKPKIIVIGVGGAGGNAVNNMIRSELQGVEFVVANTDAQALSHSLTDRRLQLGIELTAGLGAGARPEVGQQAATEAAEQIERELDGCHMAFITAGMGGGTGTGAAPVIARMARDRGILTVGVVTKPFQFEGSRRMRLAEQGLKDLQESVDTLIVIPNQNLFRIANEKTTFADAFAMADRVLHSGVRGITDLMVMPGLINLDFADVKTVMMEMGKAMMGTGESEGDSRALEAAESAIANPLLDDVSLKGAKGVLINITGGMDMTLFEVDEAANRIRSEVDPDANIIVGSTFDDALNGRLRVSVFATGIDTDMTSTEVPPPAPSYASRSTPSQPAPAPQPAAEPVAQAPAEASPAAAVPATGEVIDIRQPRVEEPVAEPVSQEAVAQAAEAESIEEAADAFAATVDEPAVAQETPEVAESRPAMDKPFISPRPMTVEQRDVLERSTSFVDAPGARAEKETASKRGPSLLDRLTGRTSRGTAQEQRREPDFAKAKPAQPRDEGPAAEPRLRPETRPEPQESGLNLGQAQAPRDEELDDQLEIPAFLRRQAN